MKRFVPTRWSHLIGYSGVGALVRADNDLFVVEDIGYWTDKSGETAGEPLCYVDLLRGTLGLDHKTLRQPPLARLAENGAVDSTVSVYQHCGSPDGHAALAADCSITCRGAPRRIETMERPRTPVCSCAKQSRLRQVDWVLAHPDGGLKDVPWHFLAHQGPGSGKDCREKREEPYLHLQRNTKTGQWMLRCERCNSQRQASIRGSPCSAGRRFRPPALAEAADG